jgi:hypothetical protein
MRGGLGGGGQTSEEEGEGDDFGVVEQPIRKIPSTNIQAQEKLQIPRFRTFRRQGTGDPRGFQEITAISELERIPRDARASCNCEPGTARAPALRVSRLDFTTSKHSLASQGEPMGLAFLVLEVQVVFIVVTHINGGSADNIFD